MRTNTIRTPDESRGDAHPTYGTEGPIGVQELSGLLLVKTQQICGGCPTTARKVLREAGPSGLFEMAASKVSGRKVGWGLPGDWVQYFAGGVRGGPDVCAGGLAERAARTRVRGRGGSQEVVVEARGTYVVGKGRAASAFPACTPPAVRPRDQGAGGSVSWWCGGTRFPGVRTALCVGDVLSSKTATS